MRKPVAAVQIRDSAVIVVCDDGSVWLRGDAPSEARDLARVLGQDQDWKEQLPIPGSEADQGK